MKILALLLAIVAYTQGLPDNPDTCDKEDMMCGVAQVYFEGEPGNKTTTHRFIHKCLCRTGSCQQGWDFDAPAVEYQHPDVRLTYNQFRFCGENGKIRTCPPGYNHIVDHLKPVIYFKQYCHCPGQRNMKATSDKETQDIILHCDQ